MATRHLLFRSTGNQLGDQQNTGQQQLVILKFVNDYSGDLELCSLSLLLPCCAFRVRKPFRTILLFQNWSINLGDVSRQLVPYAPYLAPQYSKLHWHLHFLPRKLKFDTNVAQCMGNRGGGITLIDVVQHLWNIGTWKSTYITLITLCVILGSSTT